MRACVGVRTVSRRLEQLITAYPDCPMIVSHKILTLRTDLNKLDRDHNMKGCDEK